MTRADLLAELTSERYGPTRPDERYDSATVKAARREVLRRLPPAPGRYKRLRRKESEPRKA